MSFFRKSPHEWLPAGVIAAQSEVDRRLIDQMLNGEEPPTVRELDAGTDLFRQGYFAQAVHLVLDGQVVVTVDGEEAAALGPGSVFGEMAMLGARRRTGTVTAIVPTTIASLGESRFDREDLRTLAESRGFTSSDD